MIGGQEREIKQYTRRGNPSQCLLRVAPTCILFISLSSHPFAFTARRCTSTTLSVIVCLSLHITEMACVQQQVTAESCTGKQ